MISKIKAFVCMMILLMSGIAYAADWVQINGTIDYESAPLCAMVLANGQYTFTCGDNPGLWSLDVPLDQSEKITLYGFCAGFAPFKATLTTQEAQNYNISMTRAAEGSREITTTVQTEPGSTNPDYVRISGTVTHDGTPLCAMVLANGKNMFTCGSNLGAYDLEVPLDGNRNITLYVFCSGFAPYKEVVRYVAPPNSGVDGLYFGTTDTNRDIGGIILDDGTFYILYSVENNPNVIGGVLHGICAASGGTISSSNAKDFNIEGLGIFSVSVSATYSAKEWVNGTVAYGDGTTTHFWTDYDSDYEVEPSLAALAGTYIGQVAFSLGVEDATITVSPTGIISGIGESGCRLSGSVIPRSTGNVYNVSITFGDSPCYFAHETMNGICYLDLSTNQLFAVASNASRTEGILFVGNKE